MFAMDRYVFRQSTRDGDNVDGCIVVRLQYSGHNMINTTPERTRITNMDVNLNVYSCGKVCKNDWRLDIHKGGSRHLAGVVLEISRMFPNW